MVTEQWDPARTLTNNTSEMTDNTNQTDEKEVEEKPPFGKSWNNLYGIVIINHIILIIVFVILTSLLS